MKLSPKFPLGIIINTPGAIEKINRDDALACLLKHEAADWEGLPAGGPEGKRNRPGLRPPDLDHPPRPEQHVVWIITEADQSTATLMLPSEY